MPKNNWYVDNEGRRHNTLTSEDTGELISDRIHYEPDPDDAKDDNESK